MFTTIENVWSLSIMAVIALGLLYWYFVYTFNKLAAAGIPGPKPWIFLGNVLDFFGDKEANEVERDYIEKYGKVCGYYTGTEPVVLVADPKLLRRILVKEFNKFHDRPPMESKTFYSPAARLSIVHLKGDHWKRVRSITSPMFSPSKMKQMVPGMKESLNTLMTVMEKNADIGKSFNVFKALCLFTMELNLSLTLGIKTETQKDPNNLYSKSVEAIFKFDVLLYLTKIIPFYGRILHLARLFLGPPQCIEFLAAAASRVMSDRRNAGMLSKGRDLYDLLMNAEIPDENGTILRLTDFEIIAQSISFIVANHETTASSISYTLYNLAIHSEHQEKVVEEIKEKLAEDEDINYNNIQKLEYLEMVYEENLRLFAPLHRFDRQCTESCTIDGFKFEAGFTIRIAVENIQMNPEYWQDPEKFDPERFTPQAKAKRDRFCYLPFGGGPKTCMGYRLAYLQAKIVLTSVLRKYKIVTAPETEIPPKRCVGVTSTPVNGIWLTLQRR